MNKMITRSVKVYEYTLAKMGVEDGVPVVQEIKKITSMNHLGERKISQIIKSNDEYTGFVCIGGEETEAKYAMALEDFIANAKIIDENKEEDK